MYTEASIKTDVVVATPTTFALGAIVGSRVGFAVEETEMLTELHFEGTISPTVADTPIDVTFFLDGVDQGDLVDGIKRVTPGLTTGLGAIGLSLTLRKRFSKGEHKAELRVRAAAGNVNVLGLLRPGKMSATRWSFNSVNAPAQNSKQVSGSY